jgi:hypothetical protein
MHAIALDDSRLLDTWDRAATVERPWRELVLLESACGIPFETLAHLSVGERDRLLLAIRIGTFGARLECETACPTCNARLQLALDATQLLVPPRTVDASELLLTDGEWAVSFRLPDSTDLAACRTAMEQTPRMFSLIAVCPVRAEEISADRRSCSLRERVVERMSGWIRSRRLTHPELRRLRAGGNRTSIRRRSC